MGCEINGQVRFGQYALVSYIGESLGEFLDELRLELAPGCQPNAHVTILPPRDLEGPEHAAKAELQKMATNFHAFEVKLGDVELFACTNVIYIEIERGAGELRQMHDALNRGAAHYVEPFSFHPHITLAQSIPPETVPDTLRRARQAWAAWQGETSFSVGPLVFVQNQKDKGWVDLMHLPLAPETVEVGR